MAGVEAPSHAASSSAEAPASQPEGAPTDAASPSTKATPPSQQACATSDKCGTKRTIDALDPDSDCAHKRRRPSPPPSQAASNRPTDEKNDPRKPTDPIRFWAQQGQWPQDYFELDMDLDLGYLRPRGRSTVRSPLSCRKRSHSTTNSYATSSDQRPLNEKGIPYRSARYGILLETKGTFLVESDRGVAAASKDLCKTLLETPQQVPENSLFNDDIFQTALNKINNENEARVIQDISRLIVPSAETLATFGSKQLDILAESVNAGWNNSVPLTNPRPQPDYCVGFRREAFTEDQMGKLSPFIGDFLAGEQSFFMGTYYVYFPFLTCEAKCSSASLMEANYQNAHSMTLAARAIVELFRAVGRQEEVNREILAFSVSHNNSTVRICGCFPIIDETKTEYYCFPIHEIYLAMLDGKDRWTSYRFTMNLYDIWMPSHFDRIRSAIDQLPTGIDFSVPPLADTEP